MEPKILRCTCAKNGVVEGVKIINGFATITDETLYQKLRNSKFFFDVEEANIPASPVEEEEAMKEPKGIEAESEDLEGESAPQEELEPEPEPEPKPEPVKAPKPSKPKKDKGKKKGRK